MASIVYPTPVLLSGSCTPAAGGGAPTGLDAAAMLTNTDRAPLMIDGLRFRASHRSADAQYFDVDLVGVRIRVGTTYLTNGFVPLALLASPADRISLLTGYYTWRFHSPLLLRQQERIVVEAVRFDPATWGIQPLAADTTLLVAAVGIARSTLVAPGATRAVPYATAFVGAEGALDTSTPYAAASTESDLGNPFKVPLYAERITATMWSRYTPNGSTGLWDRMGYAAYAMRRVLVHLEDARRLAITTNPIPFANVVDTLRGAWMIRTNLPARHFFLARLSGTVKGGMHDTNFRPGLGLVGSRQERI